MKICKNCGCKNFDNCNFCTQCGTSLNNNPNEKNNTYITSVNGNDYVLKWMFFFFR